jgi:hypothetical protein
LPANDTFHRALAPEIGLNSANTPGMSTKYLPAAVLVSIGSP